MNQWITVADACARYNVSQTTLRKRTTTGELQQRSMEQNGRKTTFLLEAEIATRWWLRVAKLHDEAIREFAANVEDFDEAHAKGETAKQQWDRINPQPVPITIVGGIKDALVSGLAQGAAAAATTLAGIEFMNWVKTEANAARKNRSQPSRESPPDRPSSTIKGSILKP